MRARVAVVAGAVTAATLLAVLLLSETHAAGKAPLRAQKPASAVASVRAERHRTHPQSGRTPRLDCPGQRRRERRARLSVPDPAGARLLTRREVLCTFGGLRWLRPHEIVAVQRTTYERAQAVHEALAGASPGVVNPSRVVWLMTWYYAKPVREHVCQYADCPAPEPDRIVEIRGYSQVIDAATGMTTDWCVGCIAAPRPRGD